MANKSLTFTVHSEHRRFFDQICDRLKTLFNVDIVSDNLPKVSSSIANSLDGKDGKGDRECGTDAAMSVVSTAPFGAQVSHSKSKSGCSEGSSDITWFFQNGSQEDIESAKKFASAHITPEMGYITSPHQLGNLQEFEMVKLCSKDIQRSTFAFLTFDRDKLEVTLHGSQNSVAAARLKVVMILDQLREDSDYVENEDQIKEGKFLEDPLLKAFAETEIKDKPKPPCADTQHPGAPQTDLNSSPKQGNSDKVASTTDIKHTKSSEIEEEGEDTEIITNIVAGMPFESYTDNSVNQHKKVLRQTSSTSSFTSSSCSEEGDMPDCTISTDPRYSKQIEMALKLGYTENNVIKVLKKLGPDCQRNDLLSELISVGASQTQEISDTNLSNFAWTEENSDNICNDLSMQSYSRDDPRRFAQISQLSQSDTSNNNGRYPDASVDNNLRQIIIDGSNVAMSHGKTVFSCKGIKIAVKWFQDRGHEEITAFVPQWRKETSRPDAPISDQEVLSELERDGIVVFTPSRRVQGRRVVCYDDRYILTLAVETDGIVVSNDVYRDLVNERTDFRKVVDQRLLMYTFVNDRFMPPEDPLGRLGPTLDNFLRKTPLEPSPKPQDCPYGKKCTYGNKCRFYHPERGFAPQKSITDTLKEQADLKIQERATKMTEMTEKGRKPKLKLARTKSLVPDLPMSEDFNSQGRKEKPKLAHSKSLVFPTKTPDYLNESRKKLEEAELSAVQEKISGKSDLSNPWFGQESLEDQLVLHSQSPIAATAPRRDNFKQIISDSVPPTSSSARNVSTKSPRASPSHLAVPKTEQQEEGYLSGHLLLAKKLSDEGNDNNFFSEHNHTPSSTRTTSPVVLGCKSPDQRQMGKDDVEEHVQETIGNSPYPTGVQPDFAHLKYQQQGYFQQPAQCCIPDRIPNLSIFEAENPWFSKSPETPDLLPRRQSLDSARILEQNLSSTVFPHSPDSGLYTVSTDSMSNLFMNHPDYPPPSNMQQYQSDPLSGAKQTLQSANHAHLRRAYSSTSNMQHQPNTGPQFGRKVNPAPQSNEHPTLRPQHSMPVHLQQAPHLPNKSVYLTRQNSLSDPQIRSAVNAGETLRPSSKNILSANEIPMHNPNDPMSLRSKQYQEIPNQMQQNYPVQQQVFDNRNPGQQYWQEQDMLSRNSLNKNIGFSPYAGNSMGGISQPQNSHQLAMSHHAAGYPPFLQNMGGQGIASSNTGVPSPSQPCPPHYQLQKNQYNMYPQQYGPPVPGQYPPQSHGQAFQAQSYPQQPHFPHPNQRYQAPPVQQSSFPQSVFSSPPPRPTISPKDAPISTSDQRYSTYFHLSNLFSEQTVRKVMNSNPHVTNADTLCQLVIAYNQENSN